MDFKNYYAIIPAPIRYDSDLSSTAKLLYAEITALCNKEGFCWATNSYFSSLYKVSERQIQRILKQLSDKKFISVFIDKNFKRKIFICDGIDKNVIGGMTKMSYPHDKKVVHNNINNNKMNNDNNIDDFDYDWLSY